MKKSLWIPSMLNEKTPVEYNVLNISPKTMYMQSGHINLDGKSTTF